MRTNLPITDREYPIGDHLNLISRTDLKGRITYASPAFVEVSGFAREELIGSPHNLIRHPDMPEAAFANLWATLQAGETWTGLVKNRRKDGGYYWVKAHVVPLIHRGEVQGYTSVRVRPDDAERQRAERAYRRMQAGDARGLSLDRGRLRVAGPFGRLVGRCPRGLGGRLWLVAALAVLSVGLGGLFGWPWQLAATLPLVGLCRSIQRRLGRSSRRVKDFAMQIAAGNLQAELPAQGDDELGEALQSLGIMHRSLANICADIHSTLERVEADNRELQGDHAELAERLRQESRQLQHAAFGMEQLTAMVQRSADNTRMAEEQSDSARATVARCDEGVQRLVARMTRISRAAGQMTEAIETLASQTNLLALNASVEAARAGEQGRGFGVVAQEVRALADRSASAAERSHELIRGTLQEIEAGEEEIQRLEAGNRGVIEAMTTIDDLVKDISQASQEQAREIGEINRSVADMGQVTQQNALGVERCETLGGRLAEQVRQLDQAISSFREPEAGKEYVSREQRRLARRCQEVDTDALPT